MLSAHRFSPTPVLSAFPHPGGKHLHVRSELGAREAPMGVRVPRGGHACDRVRVCVRERATAWARRGRRGRRMVGCMAGDGCVAGIWVRDCGGMRGGRGLPPLSWLPLSAWMRRPFHILSFIGVFFFLMTFQKRFPPSAKFKRDERQSHPSSPHPAGNRLEETLCL